MKKGTKESTLMEKYFEAFLTHPINRKHVDFKQLCISNMNISVIRQFEYTEEEISYLKTIPFLREHLLYNHNNFKFYTIQEIIELGNYEVTINAILAKPLTPEEITVIKVFLRPKILVMMQIIDQSDSGKFFMRSIFKRKELCNEFPNNILLYFFIPVVTFDEECSNILDVLITRDLADEQKFDIFMKIPINQKTKDFILSRKEKIDKSCLIIFSARASMHIVEKGTPIGDIYFARIFSVLDRIKFTNRIYYHLLYILYILFIFWKKFFSYELNFFPNSRNISIPRLVAY